MSPPRSTGLRRIVGSMSTDWPASTRRFSQAAKTSSTRPPPSMSQIVGDNPIQTGAPGLGLTNPHAPARRMPNTTRPSPRADRAVPPRSSRASRSDSPSAIRPVIARMMATMTTSPANTQRHEA